MNTHVDILIIGAGLTGLTLAHYLQKAHKQYVILDKSDRIGGVIQTLQQDGFVFENGPNSGVIGQSEVADLFDDLHGKCQIEIANDTVQKRYILKNGQWEAMPMGIITAIKTPLFTTKDKFRLLGEPFRLRGKNPHETLAELVKRRMGQSFLDYAIDPFILGVYAGDPNYLVPKYAFPKLYNLEKEYGSFIGGTIKKMFVKKDESARKATRQVFSVKGGLSNLINALGETVQNQNIVLNALETQINPTNNGYAVTYKHNNISKTIVANIVVTTTGAHELPKLLAFVNDELMRKIVTLKYAKVIEAVLGFNVWKGRALDGFGGLIPYKEKRDILGILFLSALFSNRAPSQGGLLTVFLGGTRREEITQLPDNEIIAILKREVSDLMQLPEFNPDLLRLNRYNYAIPQYGIDSAERLDAVNKIEQTYKNLFIGGNLINGIGMADRIKQAKMLADRIIY